MNNLKEYIWTCVACELKCVSELKTVDYDKWGERNAICIPDHDDCPNSYDGEYHNWMLKLKDE